MARNTAFVNREEELSAVSALLNSIDEDVPRIQIWQTQPASGLTAFLRHATQDFNPGRILLYADCGNRAPNSVFSQILLSLSSRYRQIWKHFEKWTVARLNDDRLNAVTASALAGLPWIGGSIKHHGEGVPSAITVTHFPSAVAQLICEFLIELTNRHLVVLILDNAQEIDDWSLDLLRTTIGQAYTGLRYMAGYVFRPPLTFDDAIDFRQKNSQLGYNITTAEFRRPNGGLVKQLCSAYELSISKRRAESIAEAAGGNIYRILAAINKLSRTDFTSANITELSPLQQRIVAMLVVAGQGLRMSDILALCNQSDTLFFADQQELSDSINFLIDHEFMYRSDLPDGSDTLLQLAQRSHWPHDLLGQTTFLQIASQLYEYFLRVRKISFRHSRAEVSPLLYRLSKQIDQDKTPIWIQELISLSLSMGSIEAAERFVQKATLPNDSQVIEFDDYMVNAAFLLSVRRYDRALEFLESPYDQIWRRERATRILEAIALNRCRKHSASESLTKELIDTSTSTEEIALLTSYLISGKLHENQVRESRLLFKNYRDIVSKAKNFAYFLRNSADAFPAKEAAAMLSEAAEIFQSNKDNFGYASTLSNRAAKLCELGQIERAQEDAEVAYEILEVFGVHHLHIVLNNRGICSLLLGDYERAEAHLQRGLRLSGTTMPWIFLKINLSAAQLLKGEARSAIETIQSTQEEVTAFPVDRVRQRGYVNAAIIGLFSRMDKNAIRRWCALAKNHPDRMDPTLTQSRIEAVETHSGSSYIPPISTFQDWFLPCYLMYWYQNPLESLPTNALASKAEVKDVGD